MALYNFEGDIDDISESQLEFINKVIIEKGFENSKVTFAPVGKAGDNYAANVKRITVQGENGNISIVAKLAPTNAYMREMMKVAAIFRNEHVMYFEVLPTFVKLQKDAGVPDEEQLKFAKCYGSFAEQPNEVILLEDLKPLGFTMLDRFVSLTDDTIKSVLKNFALLHSLAYVLKQKQPNVFDDFKSSLTDMWAGQSENPEMKLFFDTLEQQTLAVLEIPEHVNLVKDKITACLETIERLGKVDNVSKCAVLIQGDAWTNNLMFKFENDIVAESIMIDYQMSRLGNPVIDILYMIFNCTDYETRKKHYYDWIDYYHSELEKSLSYYDLQGKFVFSRDNLDNDLKRYGPIMFALSIFLASMLIRKSEDAAKVREMMDTATADTITEQMQEMGVSHLDEESINLFKTRVVGLVSSFTELELL